MTRQWLWPQHARQHQLRKTALIEFDSRLVHQFQPPALLTLTSTERNRFARRSCAHARVVLQIHGKFSTSGWFLRLSVHFRAGLGNLTSERDGAMSKSFVLEELILRPVGDSSGDVPPAYCVVINGKRSPLLFSRKQAEEAVANALTES